jgi:hypothetical protein
MRHRRRLIAWHLLSVVLWLGGTGWLVSCGTVGPIVPPENVGVNVKRQKDLAEQDRLQRQAQSRKEQEEGRPSLPAQEATTGRSTEEEQKEEISPPLPGKIVNPGARPTGDVFVMPR